MLRLLLLLALISSFVFPATPKEDVSVFLSLLPAAVQAHPDESEKFQEALLETAQLNPDLLYYQLDYFLHLYSGTPNADSIDASLRQFKRLKAQQQTGKQEWILSQLTALENHAETKKLKAYFHELYLEVRSQRFVRFGLPEPLTEDAKNRASFYACLYLDPEFGLNYDPKINFRQDKERLDRTIIQQLQNDHLLLDSLQLDFEGEDIWELFHLWYLFDKAGNSRFVDTPFSINDYILDLAQQNPPREKPAWLANIAVSGVFTSVGISLPSSEVRISRLLTHSQSRLSVAYSDVLSGPKLLGEGGLKIRLRAKDGLFSGLQFRLGLGLNKNNTANTIDADTTITHQYYPTFKVREYWTFNSSIDNFQSAILVASIQTPLWFWGDHFSVDLGTRAQYSTFTYAHTYHVVAQQTYIYQNDYEVGARVPAVSPTTVKVNDSKGYAQMFISLNYRLTDHIKLVSDITSSAVHFHITLNSSKGTR